MIALEWVWIEIVFGIFRCWISWLYRCCYGNLKDIDIYVSLFPIRYLLVVEFDIEYKPGYFLFRALYWISNMIWVCRESCFRGHWFFNPVKGKISIFEKIKTKWCFNESLIRLKMWIDNLDYQIWKVIESGVSPVLLQSDS